MDAFYRAYDKYINQVDTPSDDDPESLAVASLWDHYVLSLKASVSLYNREEYLMSYISQLIEKRDIKNVLDIACGNGRLIKQLASKYYNVEFVGIDNESAAIDEARNSPAFYCPTNCSFIRMNAVRTLPERQFDLVVSAGLFDYLDDANFARMIRRLERQINPLYVIIGNLKRHEDASAMELLGWKLIYREYSQLISLASNYFQDRVFDVRSEPLGVNLFLHINTR
jgi:2-polyprenyl-3-methyl-5-hydroxy-6-metoxy-1,4-benzoquinol methylase